jgi:hypothetical protein
MEASPPSNSSAKTPIALTVLITLAAVFVLQQLIGMRHSADAESRAKRSEALLTAQEQRNPKYDEYYRRIEEDQKRTHALIEAQEQANKRFQQILDTWERQQKEYQVYLDSLKKPQ